MEVLLSWSKPQSKAISTCFHTWIPQVIAGSKTWMSDKDINKGNVWLEELHAKLETSNFCVIVVTPENYQSPWIYFEAGAVSKLKKGLVLPYLVHVDPSDLAGNPLTLIYQCTEATEEDTWRLVKSINAALSQPNREPYLKLAFDKYWPELQACILNLPKTEKKTDNTGKQERRTDDLSNAEQELLLGCAVSERIMKSKSMHGLSVQTGGKEFCEGKSARVEAEYEGAIASLLNRGYIKDKGTKGEVFALTTEGYAVADNLKADPATPLSDNDIYGILQDWFERLPDTEKTALIYFEKVDSQTNLPSGTAKKMLQFAVERGTHQVDIKGDVTIKFKKKPPNYGIPAVVHSK